MGAQPWYLGLSGIRLNFAIAVVAGTAFWLFGYDMGVLGGVNTTMSHLLIAGYHRRFLPGCLS